jgi:hypothetical protein
VIIAVDTAPHSSAKGLSSAQKLPGIGGHQVVVEAEGHALEQIAESHPEDQRRHRPADEEAPVPGAPPGGVVDLAAVIKAHRAEEQRPQHRQHRPVEAREGGGIHQRPGRKDGAAAGDEPHLVAVPVGADGIDDDPPFGVVLADEGQQRSDAHVVAIHDGEAHQQHPDEQPPDQFERCVIQHFETPRDQAWASLA